MLLVHMPLPWLELSGDFGKRIWIAKGHSENRQVYMTEELKDNSATSWAWVEFSWSNLGSDLLSTALVTTWNELWAETAKPRRWPRASEQVKQPSTFTSPKPSSARSGLTSAIETDLGAKFKCRIFQTTRKSDGLARMSLKRLGLEQPSQAAISEPSFFHPDVPRQRKTPLSKNLHICF